MPTPIIDIGGVGTLDTAVARGLTDSADALRLLGCEVTLTGVTPAVAATLAQAGIALQGFQTARSPQEVLAQKPVVLS